MFSDILEVTRGLKSIVANTNIAVSRSRCKIFIEKYPKETTFLFSLLVRVEGFAPPTPNKSVHTENTDTWEVIFGTLLFYVYRKETSRFFMYYKSLPYTWQVIVYFTFAKNILASIGTHKYLYSVLPDVYTEDTLISMIELPEAMGDMFVTQNIKREAVTTITYPVNVYRGSKNFKISNIKFFLNYGTKIVSNVHQKTTKDLILSKIGRGRLGALIVEHRKQGFKYKKEVQVVAYGSPEDILSMYQGKTFDLANVTIGDVRLMKEVNNDKEMKLFLTDNKITDDYFVISKEGISSTMLHSEFAIAKCIDFITDTNYNPIGVICSYLEETVKVYFNVGNTQLIDGLSGRYVKLQVYKFGAHVMRVNFNSVVNVWSSFSESCKICGTTHKTHSSNGVCRSCVSTLRHRVYTGGVEVYSLAVEPFKVYLENYEVIGDGTKVSFNLVEGQGVLPLW